MKTLKTYFDNWCSVLVHTNDVETEAFYTKRNFWCERNVNAIDRIRRRIKFKSTNPNSISHISGMCYMFRKEEDALMFVLTFGGEVTHLNQF